jgi:hypothetical protein
MAHHANSVHAGSHPATKSPDRVVQADTPGELNVWLFVSVVPVTFAAVIVALAMIVHR